jgi:hypothetical protein
VQFAIGGFAMRGIGTIVMLCVSLTAAACNRVADDARVNGESDGAIGTSGAAEADPTSSSLAPTLSDAQLARLQERLTGTWLVNLDRSMYFLSSPPKPPLGYIYTRADKNGMRYTNSAGSSIQLYDGKAYPVVLGGGNASTTASRTPLDEFTVEVVLARDGKPETRTTQVISPDGKTMVSIRRRIDEHGLATPGSFEIHEKVPEGTPVWAEQPKK